MRRFRKPTIKEVAQRAGVSISTVSIFMNGREDVCSAETGQRIRTAVAALNYTPSSLVSGMQKHTTTTIGVCMHQPLDTPGSYVGLFIERLWIGILAEADDEDYSILHYPASVRNSGRYDTFLDGRVDGVIFHPEPQNPTPPEKVADAGMPTVLLTRSFDASENCGVAYFDEARTVDLALSHLWDLGHRRIAHLAGPVERHSDIAVRRRDYFTAWLKEHGVAGEPIIANASGWAPDHTDEIVEEWARLGNRPTAVFCANDALALAVIDAALRRGWRVPDDLSVVGVDNSYGGRDAQIPLTSIDIALDAVGRASVTALLRLMRGAPMADCRIAISDAELVARASTGPAPRASRPRD